MKKKNQELEVEYFVRHRNIRKRKEYITRDSSFRKNQRSAVWNSRSVKLNFPEASAWHREGRLTRDYRYLSDNIASSMKWSLTEASILPPLVIRQFENWNLYSAIISASILYFSYHELILNTFRRIKSIPVFYFHLESLIVSVTINVNFSTTKWI